MYLNNTNPQLDTISVLDPRDGAAIFWTRQELGKEFDKITKAHRGEALVVQTKYPLKMIAEYIMKRANIDIQYIDEKGLPEGWEDET